MSVKKISRVVQTLLWVALAVQTGATFTIWAVTGSTQGGAYGIALTAHGLANVGILVGGWLAIRKATEP